jgi:RNA polymerase sigma factor (sigma-70 family)
MGNLLDSEHSRSLPGQLQVLLEAAEAPQQDRAWTAFLDSYSRLILYVARQIPRDHDAVMDRYAFVLERLREQNFRRLRSFAADGRGKFTTWLVVVVRRLCLDHDRLRHGRASPQENPNPAVPRRLFEVISLDPELLDRFPDKRPSADEVLDRQQLLDHLDRAVATLSANDRLLLALRYQDGRSAREIATLMSLPTPFHVYRWLNRVHTALRQALAAPSDRPRRVLGAAPDPSAVQYQWRSDGPLEPSP